MTSAAPVHAGREFELAVVRGRFRRMVELGRACENDDYIIFRWEW